MKKKLLLPIALLAVTWCHAQTLSPTIIGSAGGFGTYGSGSLAWTIGEPVVSTESTSSNILTQGFHQTHPAITISTPRYYDGNMAVYPNPARETVTISSPEQSMSNWKASIFSTSGQVVLTQTLNGFSSGINISYLPDGLYIIRIDDQSNTTISNQKLHILK